jgi:hypothetical protein
MKLTTHLHLVPRSKNCGAIPPLPQYVFMAWYLVDLVRHRDNSKNIRAQSEFHGISSITTKAGKEMNKRRYQFKKQVFECHKYEA